MTWTRQQRHHEKARKAAESVRKKDVCPSCLREVDCGPRDASGHRWHKECMGVFMDALDAPLSPTEQPVKSVPHRFICPGCEKRAPIGVGLRHDWTKTDAGQWWHADCAEAFRQDTLALKAAMDGEIMDGIYGDGPKPKTKPEPEVRAVTCPGCKEPIEDPEHDPTCARDEKTGQWWHIACVCFSERDGEG